MGESILTEERFMYRYQNNWSSKKANEFEFSDYEEIYNERTNEEYKMRNDLERTKCPNKCISF